MNGSWSDQDLSRESDLIGPGGETEGLGDAVHQPDGNQQDDDILYADHDENNHEMMDSVDGAGPASQEPSEDGYSSSSSLGMEYADQDEEEDPEEAGMVGGDDSDPQDASHNMTSSLGDGDSPTDRTGAKRHQGVLNMHHVDMILDNIDAQLNEIINRSLNSENSENSYHDDVTSPGRTGVGKMVLMRPGPAIESGNDATAEDRGLDDGSASDTGLGTGSHAGNCSPTPGRRDYPQEQSALANNGATRRTSGASKKRNGSKKRSKRQIVVEVSDVDSICSEDVRIRMEETLNFQDYDSDAPLSSEHSQPNPSHSHDALQNHAGSYSAASTANHDPGVGTSDEMDSETEGISLADCEPEDISSRIQEMVSMVLSHSTNEAPQSEETDASPESTKPSRHPKHLPKSSNSTPRTKPPSVHSTAADFVAPNSRSFLEFRRAGRGVDADSIATEDFEHVFQESIIPQYPSSRSKTKNPSQTHNNPSGHARGRTLPQTTQSSIKIDRLTVPVVGKSGKPRSRKKRSLTMETSRPSGLPEFMYLRKGISESDVGSDSIRTEDYEGHFEVARVVDLRTPSTKYANRSNNSLTGRALNVQSDPESVQTEEYEQRFRSLMVKQVAGVPLKSFDQVTIASDLESVETGMVHQKFQEALRKGPEVRLFDEFGDQSDLDPVQMADVERKFQAIRRQKKLEKMRHSHHDGDTDDEGTSDVDSVRAVRSKSESGSPPTRQSVNGHSAGQAVHNGTHGKPIGRSQDGSQRSGNRVNTTSRQPNHTQQTSSWGEQRGSSPMSSRPSPGGPTSVHPHAQGHGNHDMRHLQRSEQASCPSWQDPSVGRQRAAAWNAQRQDSISTYEEVESLHSHQCSSLQSQDNSCVPSRLQSFGSTSSSIDQSLPQLDGAEPCNSGIIQVEDNLSSLQGDEQESSLESESSRSVSFDGKKVGHLKAKLRRSIIDDDDDGDEMNSSVAKWVDQTRAETARRRSHVGLPEGQPVRSHEAPEGSQQACSSRASEKSLTALNMQCGDVIPGTGIHHVRLPNETDLELALRVGNASPVSLISRCASIDSNHSSSGSEHPKPEIGWTIAEDVLINLGFAGSNMGIPDRFLKSWREQALKQRVKEVQRLLGNSVGGHLLQNIQTVPEKASPSKERKLSVKEDQQNRLSSVSSSLSSESSNSAAAHQPPEKPTSPRRESSPQVEDAVMSRQRGADKAKLVGLRRSLKKAATVSSFGQTLAEISKQGPPNPQVVAQQQAAETPPAARRSPGGGKYSPFNKTHKSSARDRRRKYMRKQSSLPISLETLEEEDETLKPPLVLSKPLLLPKHMDSGSHASKKHHLKGQSLEDGDEPAFHCKLKIVMEQPSIESREAMSRQGTTDVDLDEAIADIDMDKRDHKVSMEQYLVVKAIIDSKDSGFENEPSRTGSPQISPRSSEDETTRGTGSKTVTTAHSTLRRSKSSELAGCTAGCLLMSVSPKQEHCSDSSVPSTLTKEASQENHKESQKGNQIQSKFVESTPEMLKPSKTKSESDVVAATVKSDTKVNGRSFSTGSERRGPSLADIQDEFSQTIVEDDDDVFASSIGGHHQSDSVSACCQTSPTLHSPLLSPLSFLESERQHPGMPFDCTNTACDNSVKPDICVGASQDTALRGNSEENQDAVESVVTTGNELKTSLLPMNLSQEISDGGLSIITEKEEELTDHSAISNSVTQNEETMPSSSTANDKGASSGVSEPDQSSNAINQTTSDISEKSRNPFKSSESFFSSSHNSNPDFDFYATIEEDEDGEQYSDAESFSKVSFAEVTPMAYESSEVLHTSDQDPDSVQRQENGKLFFPDPKNDPIAQNLTDLPDDAAVVDDLNDASGEATTGDKPWRSKETDTTQENASSTREQLPLDDLKEISHEGNAVTMNTKPILENDIPSAAVAGNETLTGAKDGNEEDLIPGDLRKDCLISASGDEGVISSKDTNSSTINGHSKASVLVVSSGGEDQIAKEGQNNQPPTFTSSCQKLEVTEDYSVQRSRSMESGTVKASDDLGIIDMIKDQRGPEMKSYLHSSGQTGKPEVIGNPVHKWNLNFDQPQIIRSTSVETHLNSQRRKLRTLSERSTLYSDGMEPLLCDFGRVFTERSNSSTEGFRSFGSDIFHRPLTVTQTLQQVASKLESYIRQRSLVSIQDEEGEEEEEEERENLLVQNIPRKAAIDSMEKKQARSSKRKETCFQDAGCEEVAPRPNGRTSSEKQSISNLNIDENSHAHDEQETLKTPNLQKDQGTNPDVKDLTSSSTNNSINAKSLVSEITDKSTRRHFSTSSKFLSVPSMGHQTDSTDGSYLSVSSTESPKSKCGQEAELPHGLIREQTAEGKELDCQDKSASPVLENVTSGINHGKSKSGMFLSSTEITETNFHILKSAWSPESCNNPGEDFKVNMDVKDVSVIGDASKNLPVPSGVDDSLVNSQLGSDVASLSLKGSSLAPEGTVLHSQFYRSEKFLAVSQSSDGKVDFVESDRHGNNEMVTHQIPTFLSEVQFHPSSTAPIRSTSQSSTKVALSPSRSSTSIDTPPPAPTLPLTPTFEDICTKAGRLILQLQETLAHESRDNFQSLPAEIVEREEDIVSEAEEGREEVDIEEEEEDAGNLKSSRDQTNHWKRNGVNHQSSSNPHSYEPPRMKQGMKKRKKRPIRENGVRTSIANANPGNGRHHLNNVSQDSDERESRPGQDQMATIRELLETETKMRKKLDDLESSFEEVSAKKQAAVGDLKDLREAVHRNKRDIKTAEEIARESMERADGLRSELMVLEYQRDQARRDLQDMTQSVDAIQQSHGRSAPDEKTTRTSGDVLGLSPKDVFAVIKERNELKTRVRNGEGDLSPIERSELERQLNYTKQELFNDQKVSRAKMESLQEDLEESRHKFQELLVEKTTLAEKLRDLKEAISSSERVDQTSSQAEERNKLLEQLAAKLQKELDGARHQVHEKDQRLLALTALVSEKDKLYDALKEKMVDMQKKEVEEKRETEKAVAEAEGKARNADVVKELALVELRETLLREKQEEVEQLKLSLEKDKKVALAALDEKTSQILLVTQRSLTEKEDDLKAVKLQLVQQTEEAHKMEQKLRELADEQVKAAVEKERSELEGEYKRRRREENIEKELEVAKETSRLQGELHVTRQRLEHSQTTLAVLKEELDKIRAENLAAGREKVEAVSEAREKARDDIQRELDQLREQLAKENLLEVDRLRLKLSQQDEELTKLRSEVKNHQQKEARSNSVMDSKSILAEINEECKRTAAVIESTPLKMNLSSIRSSKALNGTLSPKGPFSSTPKSTLSPGRTQVMAALTNLRISNEELRNHVQTLKTDLERQKRAASKAQKEKDEEVKKVANTIERKSEDMETMKDTLIQDHLTQVEDLQQQLGRLRTTESSLQQRLFDKDSELREIQQSMTQWKEETALKMAKKFEEELSKELEIRMSDTGKRDGSAYRGSQSDLRSKHSSDMSTPSSTSDASTIRLLRHLQERVKQLRTENLSLRKSSRGLESSGEERGSPHSSKSGGSNDKDHLLYQLQQRVKLLERQLQVAEERCREHAASVSDKTSDNNRLQNALTQQTKELMKMERAYSKLANPPRTPIRL